MFKKDYQKRESKEYNWFRGIFQWITCSLVYAPYYKLVYGLKIEGRENVDKNKTYIVASNHVSAIDPFLVIHAVNRNLAYMAKVELFKSKISRFFLDLLGAFAVDRSKLSVSTIKTVKGLKDTNWCLGIFPQGTREKVDSVENVNKGFASFARTLKCDILPVAITGMSKDERKIFHGKMKIKIGKPIPYNNDIDTMVELWEKSINKMTKDEEELQKEKTKNYAQKKAKDFNILTRLYQYYAMYILYFPLFATFFYDFNFKKTAKLEKKPYILAPNHISYMDVFIVNHAFGRPLAYMAKQELFKTDNWKHNYIAKNVCRLGAFAVNREKVSISTIKSVKEVFKAKYNLCIFPQGGIRKNKAIENINGGFVYFAKANKIDIVPLGIRGLEEYNWKMFKKQKVDVIVGKPISYKLDEEEIVKQWCEQICALTGYENKQNYKK